MNFDKILANVEQYYSEKVTTHGAQAVGVDWNSQESQFLRFEQLLKVCDSSDTFSINDYGCGYGALVDYMTKQGYGFNYYYGFDLSRQMINQAIGLHGSLEQCVFSAEKSRIHPLDYTVASGIFNVKSEVNNQEWEKYLLTTLEEIAAISNKGFAFNVLTKYSDSERMRSDLYYADPCYLFDYCQRHFSRNVALLHDYDLYEFTIIVRK